VVSPRPVYHLPLPTGSTLTLGERPLVMGILNVTPDSFAEAGPRLDPDASAALAEQLAAEGADIIDIGGESTRPGAVEVAEADELARVVPVLRKLAGRMRIPISVDTSKAAVARAALAEGAAIVNDVTALQGDPDLARVAADERAALVLMHMRGRPRTMYAEAQYGDVVAEVIEELRSRVDMAVASGVPRDRLIVDPGIGFAKQPAHSYGVLARLPELAAALDLPVLVGPSRKSFMREALGGREALDRDWGTAASVAAAILAGAHIVRVHAVKEMVQVVRVSEEIRRQSPTGPCR
jgi:dihydropteroate synthase